MRTRTLIQLGAGLAALSLLGLAVSPASATTVHNPSISSVSPATGSTNGDTKITVEGKYFTGATEVTVGGVDATTLHVSSSTKLTAYTPAADVAGAVAVQVTTPVGSSATTSHDKFTYVAPPMITSLSTHTGTIKGGTRVTITGTGFTKITSVKFEGIKGTSLEVSSKKTSLKITTPKHAAGAVDVLVTGTYGSSTATDGFTYVGPSAWSGVNTDASELEFSGISCVTSTFCVAVNGGSDQSTYDTFDGVTWSDPSPIGSADISSVSCTSTTFCVAVGGNSYSTYDGMSWATPVPIDDNFALTQVSCASSTFCEAIDQTGLVYKFNGTTWTSQSLANVEAAYLGGISCASSTLCVAVGSAYNGDGDLGGVAFIYNGTSWKAKNPVESKDAEGLQGVSCAPGGTDCVAIDNVGESVSYSASSAKWASAVKIPSGGSDGFDALTCPVDGTCLAVSYSATTAKLSNGAWTRTTHSGADELTTVSCASTSYCIAAGTSFSGDDAGDAQYFIYS